MVKAPQRLTLVQSHVIGLITFDLVLRVVLARMMDITFVVHLARMHLHDTTTDPASFGIPTYVVADFEFPAHNWCYLVDHSAMTLRAVSLFHRSMDRAYTIESGA